MLDAGVRQTAASVDVIHTLNEHRFTGWITQGEEAMPHVYADADFAWDAAAQRSTSGVHLCIEGETSHFPLHDVSKRQDSVSSSTLEAELVSGHFVDHKVLLLALGLWEVLLPMVKRGVFHEDNTAMIQVIKTGRNPTMKHLHRVHRICVASMHERLGGS